LKPSDSAPSENCKPFAKEIGLLRNGAEGTISGTEGWCVRPEKHFFDIIFIFFLALALFFWFTTLVTRHYANHQSAINSQNISCFMIKAPQHFFRIFLAGLSAMLLIGTAFSSSAATSIGTKFMGRGSDQPLAPSDSAGVVPQIHWNNLPDDGTFKGKASSLIDSAGGFTAVTLRNSGSTDHVPFQEVGLPGFQFIQDPRDYESRSAHTNQDTFERLSKQDLKQAATVMAIFVYNTAQRDAMLPRNPLPHPELEEQHTKPLEGIYPSKM